MKHTAKIAVALRTSPPAAVRAGEHVATIRCSCGWTDEHPNGTADEVRARAAANVAEHRRLARGGAFHPAFSR